MNRDELADGLVHEWADWWTTEDVEKIDADNGEYLDKLIKRSVAYAETARLSPPVAAPDGLRRLVNAVKAVVDRHAETKEGSGLLYLPMLPREMKKLRSAVEPFREPLASPPLPEGERGTANLCAKIFDHKWLDPVCVETGCQSLVLKHEAERAQELADKYKWQVIDTCKRAEAAEAKCASLQAELDAARKALEPFAHEAAEVESYAPEAFVKMKVRVWELLAARRAALSDPEQS